MGVAAAVSVSMGVSTLGAITPTNSHGTRPLGVVAIRALVPWRRGAHDEATARGVPRQARLREHARARAGVAEAHPQPEAPFRRAGASRPAPPLRPATRTRRRAVVVGGPE